MLVVILEVLSSIFDLLGYLALSNSDVKLFFGNPNAVILSGLVRAC